MHIHAAFAEEGVLKRMQCAVFYYEFVVAVEIDYLRLALLLTKGILHGEVLEDEVVVPMEQSCNYQLSECYESGGAGLISSTEDYAKLADALACGGESADGVRILKPETVERIKQNLLGEVSLGEIATNMGRKGYGYGCGMMVLMHPESVGSPAPAGVFGWDGAAGSCIQMDTASKTSFVYTQHVRNCGMSYDIIHPALRDMVFG